MIFHKLRRSYVLLLEVLIAIAIVAMCVLPLLAPHATILIQQQRLLKKSTLDHVVGLLYVDVLEQMHRNAIPWGEIQKHTPLEIDESMVKRAGYDKPFPFRGTFRFDVKPTPKSGEPSIKGNKESALYVYKLVVTFVFTPTVPEKENEKYVFPYELTVLRKTANGPDVVEKAKEDAAKEKKE